MTKSASTENVWDYCGRAFYFTGISKAPKQISFHAQSVGYPFTVDVNLFNFNGGSHTLTGATYNGATGESNQAQCQFVYNSASQRMEVYVTYMTPGTDGSYSQWYSKANITLMW